MNTNIENLNQLPLNKIGKIKKIDCEECIKKLLVNHLKTSTYLHVM